LERMRSAEARASEPRHLGAVPLRSDLLRTKLAVPHVRRPVERRRLLDRLNEVYEGAMTLLSAPAGFGKTTLMAQWAREAGTPVAWLSLDEGDDDPVRFMSHLLAALGAAAPELDDCLPGLGMGGFSHPEEALTPLVNGLQGIGSIALCLDDYHRIRQEAVHRAVAFLVENRPPNLYLVIGSRSDPALPLSRMRARGQLVEVGADDLRFTVEEARLFFHATMNLDAGAEAVRVLQERTEGWIAGLQLAAHAAGMRLEEDEAARFARRLGGNSRHVADYLVDEVFSHQRQDVREFLLKTSILDRLCAPLCEAVTGAEGAQDMLEALERANLFVVLLDEERRWYRYHHLFAQFLRGRLERLMPGQAPRLHGRAAAWYKQQDQALVAAEHAMAAEDPERAAELVAGCAGGLLDRGEVALLARWGERLPASSLQSRPRLGVSLAWADLISGHLDRAEQRAQEALAHLGEPCTQGAESPTSRDGLIGRAMAVEACVARARGDLATSARLSDRALRFLPRADRTAHGIVALNLGVSQGLSGEREAARAALLRAREESLQGRSAYVYCVATRVLADLEVQEGKLDRALALYGEAMNLEELRQLPAVGVIHAGMAELLYEKGDLDGATFHAGRSTELGEAISSPDVSLPARAVLALLKHARGDTKGALGEVLKGGRACAGWSKVPHVINQRAANEARLLLALGDATAASECLKRWVPSADHSMVALNELRPVLLARVLLAEGRNAEAAELLRGFIEQATGEGRRGSEARLLALLALALRGQGDEEAAVRALDRALSLSEPGGCVRSFVDEGPPMAALLRRAVAKGVHPLQASRLLAAFAAPGEPAARMPEILSAREREVMRLVAAGMSNEQIASALFVALSTVKKHLNNSYRKLDVDSRVQAVSRAREFGLL